MSNRICIFLLLLSFSPSLWGQEEITGNFEDILFEDFVQKVESQSDYRFYYLKSELDTFAVNYTATGETLDKILRRIFRGTDFNYSINQKAVFVSYGWKISTELPDDYFGNKPAAHQNAEDPEETKKEDNRLVVDYFSSGESGTETDDQLVVIGVKTNRLKAGETEISGRVVSVRNGEPITGATVLLDQPRRAVSTDPLGYYTLSVPYGRSTITFSSMGMRSSEKQVMVYGPGTLNAELHESVQSLKEVTISAKRDENITRAEMGVENLSVKQVKNIPMAMGEADVVRAVLTLPGVKSVGEASTGFNVRGGSTDQNLILYGAAPIYNPSHLFGFFSSFNSDVVSNLNLYKSSIPAEFGGRLSSVLDIETRKGNKKKFTGSGGIGLVTGRLALEGPIVKDQTSFLLSGRTTYSDWVLGLLENQDYAQSSAGFYDLNLNISHEVDKSNQLQLNLYHSNDRFRFKRDTTYQYENSAASLQWKSLFSDKLVGNFSLAGSRYNYSVIADRNPVNAFDLQFGIDQIRAKAAFDYYLNTRHSLNFGFEENYYQLQPGTYQPVGNESLIIPEQLQSEQALESALFFSDEYQLTADLSVNAGIRYSLFNYLGDRQVYQYQDDLQRSEFTVIDTLNFSDGENIQTYQGPEFRVSMRYTLPGNNSLKASFNSLRQHIHMISNTTAISPTDIWKLSDSFIKPQQGRQYSLGYYHNFFEGALETSLEVYYKEIDNFLDYRSGATLIMNPTLETDIINTRGRAYGVELLLKKTTGKLNGWLSYTYSRSLLQQDDDRVNEEINDGEWYPSNFDQPHDVTLVGNYRFSHRLSFSLNFTYQTGRPITLPVAKYNYGGSERVYYSDRNAYRIPDFYRTDVALNLEGNHRQDKLFHTSWTFAIYNLTGRNNPYSVYYTARNGEIQGYKLSIFGNAIPTVTLNFKF